MTEGSPDFTPVIMLTGFLGSGKTTLLTRLLKDPSLADTAVLINEFGEVGLDHLLVDRLDEEIVLLSSGCLCCTIRGELADALRRLHGRRERGEIPPFKRVVIETTGLADPLPIIATITVDPVLRHHFRMGGIVTTVDAVNVLDQLDRQPESVTQVAVADWLLLTKTDLVAQDAISVVTGALARLNPDAPLLHATEPLDAAALLGERTASGSFAHKPSASRAQPTRSRGPLPHIGAVTSFAVVFEEALDWTRFGLWLSMLVNRHGSAILRIKGLLAIDGTTTPVAIHCVQHIVHVPQHLAAWPDPHDTRSRLVFITRGLAPALIERSMTTFGIVSPEGPSQRVARV